MLSDLFKPFIEASPRSVMMRGLVERLLSPEQIDQGFPPVAAEQYTRNLLFSTGVRLMVEVVCGSRTSVGVVYQAMAEAIAVSIQAVDDKLQGVEPAVAAELVRYTVREGQAILAAIAALPPEMPSPAVQPVAPASGEPKRAGKAVKPVGETMPSALPAKRLSPSGKPACRGPVLLSKVLPQSVDLSWEPPRVTEPLLQAEPVLADLAKPLEQWRQLHPATRDPLPSRFWEQAVRLATWLPRSQVAERLDLSLAELQQRCLARQEALVAEAASPHPGFVEVRPDGIETLAVPQAAVIEVERPDGVRLRLQYQEAPPLATVLRAFLEVGPCCS